jgi:hypothetical protein
MAVQKPVRWMRRKCGSVVRGMTARKVGVEGHAAGGSQPTVFSTAARTAHQT